jgi:uncharacterized membrane protein YfcA
MLLSDLGLPSNLAVWLAALLLGLSLFIGLLGGLIGLSLGTMRLPAMLMLGVPLPVAASANIFVSSVVGVSGSYRHFRDGRVKLRLVFIIGIPAFVSGFLGGFFSNQSADCAGRRFDPVARDRVGPVGTPAASGCTRRRTA